MVADRVAKVGFSSTLKISARAKSMRADGIDVVDFSVGEPDFPTPDHIKAAGVRAIEKDFTRYTQASGIPELKAAIAHRLEEDHGLRYRPEEIIVSTGAKASLYFLLLNRSKLPLVENNPEALKSFAEVSELAKAKSPERFFWQGMAAGVRKNWVGAIEKFNDAIKINKKFPEAYYGRAQAHFFQQDYRGAEKDLDKAGTKSLMLTPSFNSMVT